MIMEHKGPDNISIAEVKQKFNLSHIDDDLVLFDNLADMRIADGPHRNTGIIVGLCLQGGFHYTVNTEEHDITPGDAIIIHDGQVIDDYCADDGSYGIGIMMTYGFFHEIVKGVHELSSLFLFSRSHPVFRLLPAEIQTVRNYFALIKEKVDDKCNYFRKDVARLLISAMIYDLSNAIYRIQQNNDRKQTSADKIFTAFIRLVEQNYRQERRVGWYGRQLCITSKYLSEIIRQVSRRTPNEWIDNYVIMELRVQLANTTKSVKEIAHEMNFPNQSSMGKFFKDHVGMSPLSYRKKQI